MGHAHRGQMGLTIPAGALDGQPCGLMMVFRDVFPGLGDLFVHPDQIFIFRILVSFRNGLQGQLPVFVQGLVSTGVATIAVPKSRIVFRST